MALVKDYFEKTIKYKSEYGENSLVLMQVGAFFEVYGLQNKTTGETSGSNILDFSRICDLNIADKKICVGTDNVIMAGFSHYMLDKYLKKLQEAGYTTAVYIQDEQMKNTTRSLAGIYSPGTYFSNDFSQITNNTTCIWVSRVDAFPFAPSKNGNKNRNNERNLACVGLANIDVYTGKTSIFEFQEGWAMNPTTFDQLERFISIYNPSEVIMIGNIDEAEMNTIINYSNIQSSSIHKISLKGEQTTEAHKRAINAEKQKYQKEILEKFYVFDDFHVFYQNFYENSMATQAFCFLLDFVYQHNPNLVHKICEPVFENCSDRLVLANHSLKQLNIIDDGQHKGVFSSVEKMMNQCVTAMGRRRFSYALLNPTTNIDILNDEYNIIEHFLSHYDSYRAKMSPIKDISKLQRLIIMRKVAPRLLFQFYKNLFSIGDLLDIIDEKTEEYLSKKNISRERVKKDKALLSDFIETHFDVAMCEDIEQCGQFETNFIKRGTNAELDKQSQTLAESQDKLEAIRQYLNTLISKYEKNSKTTEYIKIHETEKNSFSLTTTKRRCVLLKQCLESSRKENTITLEFVSSYSGKPETFVFLPEVSFSTQSTSNDAVLSKQIDELCKNISSVKIGMKDLLTSIYVSLLGKLEELSSSFENLANLVLHLDCVANKAYIAKKYSYCKPVVKMGDGGSFVHAENLRHAIIEQIQQNEIYVANTIVLGKKERGILLYGTNAVGKTSLIRSLGIAVIMAQAGLYVPCSSFEYTPYKTIFTRILGNDNIFKGLSTFAVEMSELRTILRLADKQSLILGDELCSGTESISATSIFVAGIQQLHQKESHFIFATHLHEIVGYSEIEEMRESVALKHMAIVYDRENDLLKYDRKMRDGPGDNMYGLEVCKSLNLPEVFLESAHKIRNKYHPQSGSILSLETSHFNTKKVMSLCEVCKKEMSKEVHHLQHQQTANEDGIITTGETPFSKNHLANLINVCEKCHDEIHREKGVMHKKVKTTKGTKIEKIRK
jgi:DNA mismatch repair protein MutS